MLFSPLVFFRLMTATMIIAAKRAAKPTGTMMDGHKPERRLTTLKTIWLQFYVLLKIMYGS